MHIQTTALELFRAQGYEATIINDIAKAAGTSPATFFRYFATKEDVALYDSFDQSFMTTFLTQPAELSPIQAMRQSFYRTFTAFSSEEAAMHQARYELIFHTPALRARLLSDTFGSVTTLAQLVAKRIGHSPDDRIVRAIAGAYVGVGMSTLFEIAEQPGAGIQEYMRLLDATLNSLDESLL